MSSLNTYKVSSSKGHKVSSSQERNLVPPLGKKIVCDMSKKVSEEGENGGKYLSVAIEKIDAYIKGISIEIDEVKKKKEEFERMNYFFDELRKENIFSLELFRKYDYVIALEKKLNQSLEVQLKLRDTSQEEKKIIKQIQEISALDMEKRFLYLSAEFNNSRKKKIPLLRDYIRIFARNYEQSFSLKESLERCLKQGLKKTSHTITINQHKECYDIYRKYTSNLNGAIANAIINALEKYNTLINDFKNETFLPVWDEDVPEVKIDVSVLKKFQESLKSDGSMQPLEVLKRSNLEAIQNRIQSLEEQALQRANDMMRLLLQEEEEHKQQQVLLHSAPSPSKQKFISEIEQDNIVSPENISETGTSPKPSPQEYYNQKLYEKWENYLKPTEYRAGHWNGKEGISIPLMNDYFPSQMQFRLSIKEVITHLEKRHPEFVQDLSEAKKQDIKDNDGFKVIMSKYNSEIHNLIFELSSQLLNEDTMIYKSKFYTDAQTGSKIKNPTIMIRGKNKDDKLMLSAWGLYEAEKGSAIKFHLLSCYPDDNQNRTLPQNAMKISGECLIDV